MNLCNYPKLPLLIIDDKDDVLDSYSLDLNAAGINNLILCSDSRKVLPLLKEQKVSVIILDLFMPYISGEALLPRIKEEYPGIPVVIITASDSIDTAIHCMKNRAFDYLVKPVEIKKLHSTINRALEIAELHQTVSSLKKHLLSNKLENKQNFSEIITNNNQMISIFLYLEAIAESPKPILITGESGVGKELIARTIHKISRVKGSFVPVNISGLDDTMFSDTLFGHVRGAFTGADKRREGLIEKARGGTLFLDEIGDLEPSSQVKLLRLIENNEYYTLGSDTITFSRARLVVATNTDLYAKTGKSQFRKDLYYRLITHHVEIPPLRERTGDIPLLTDHFLARAAASLGKKKPVVPGELYTLLATYSFPGNIRELQAMLFDAVSRHKQKMLSLTGIHAYIKKNRRKKAGSIKKPVDKGHTMFYTGEIPTLKEAESFLIKKALEKAGGVQSIAAQILGISTATLSRRVRELSKK